MFAMMTAIATATALLTLGGLLIGPRALIVHALPGHPVRTTGDGMVAVAASLGAITLVAAWVARLA